MIRGVVPVAEPSAFTSSARVDTVKVCAASALAPPVVPEPDAAQPSLAGSTWWYRSVGLALAFITRPPAPAAAATAAAETTRVRRLRSDRRWDGRGEAEATDDSLRNVRGSEEHVVRTEPL
jgi:hypothetical protein